MFCVKSETNMRLNYVDFNTFPEYHSLVIDYLFVVVDSERTYWKLKKPPKRRNNLPQWSINNDKA